MAIAANAKPPEDDLPIDDIVRQHLKSMFATYPKLTNKDTPSSWFVWNAEGKIKDRFLEACHANLKYDGAGWDDLITAVPLSDPLSIAYIRMLIHGPFKAFSDLVALKKVSKKVKKKDADEVKIDNYYLHLTSLEGWPANVLYNFCVASRLPNEAYFKNALPMWAESVKKGFDPVLAFLLAWSTNGLPLNEMNLQRKFIANGHMWLDAPSNWSSIIKGDMIKMSESFKMYPYKCTPSNIIWGTSPDYKKIMTMSDEDVAKFYGLPIEPPAADPPLVTPAARPKKQFFIPPQPAVPWPGIPPAEDLHQVQEHFNVIHDGVFLEANAAPAPAGQPQPILEDEAFEPLNWPEEEPAQDFV